MGTAMDRNTIVSRIRERPTTKMPNGSRAPDSRVVMSRPMAVTPVTVASTPYLSFQPGAFAWIRLTRSSVRGSSGAVVGTTWIIAVSAFALGTAIGTDATPSMCSMSDWMPEMTPSGSLDWTTENVTMRGPLAPGPNAVATASYVWRAGELVASWPALGRDSHRSLAG